MPFAYYERLSSAQKKIYRRSDEIGAIALPREMSAGTIVASIRRGLIAEDRRATHRASQALVDALVAGYRVPRVRLKVLARRPSNDYGELHGLYEPAEGRAIATIMVWMRTAQRRQVVAFKSFLRTLTHEFAHHLDYELFLLEETFHTEGFYKRESSLANALLAQEADSAGGPESAGATTGRTDARRGSADSADGSLR